MRKHPFSFGEVGGGLLPSKTVDRTGYLQNEEVVQEIPMFRIQLLDSGHCLASATAL
jgi:hypothetical protein